MADIEAMTVLDREHFAAIPWCARHLKGNRVIAQTPVGRIPKSTGEDALFSTTINSGDTIARLLHVYEEPPSPTERISELKAFLTLGRGLNGHPNVCHGGLVTTILDEVIGDLFPLNMGRDGVPHGAYMTAYLNTTFIKPVLTPTTVLARTRLTKIDGRKYFTQGTIEDEGGIVLARTDALFVRLKSTL